MNDTRTILNLALAGVLAAGLATQAQAADKPDKGEKCYGIVKASKNDCQTASSACAGQSKTDAQPDAFIYVPKGTCDRIVGGTTTPKK
jgi:uncharacterized membrane protein